MQAVPLLFEGQHQSLCLIRRQRDQEPARGLRIIKNVQQELGHIGRNFHLAGEKLAIRISRPPGPIPILHSPSPRGRRECVRLGSPFPTWLAVTISKHAQGNWTLLISVQAWAPILSSHSGRCSMRVSMLSTIFRIASSEAIWLWGPWQQCLCARGFRVKTNYPYLCLGWSGFFWDGPTPSQPDHIFNLWIFDRMPSTRAYLSLLHFWKASSRISFKIDKERVLIGKAN